MRKCWPHLEQTLRFVSRSFFQMIWRQLSHFSHSPSVLTRFSLSSILGGSVDLSRLNQDTRDKVARYKGIWQRGDEEKQIKNQKAKGKQSKNKPLYA